MLPLTDSRWRSYKSGYRIIYDAAVPLRQLFQNHPPDTIWKEFWQELHHQGDVDTASYAVVPYLVRYVQQQPHLDWNVFGLIGTIELVRPRNPPLPSELVDSYFESIRMIPAIVGNHPQQQWNEPLTQCAVACIALARGQRIFARTYLELHVDAARQWLRDEIGNDADEG